MKIMDIAHINAMVVSGETLLGGRKGGSLYNFLTGERRYRHTTVKLYLIGSSGFSTSWCGVVMRAHKHLRWLVA